MINDWKVEYLFDSSKIWVQRYILSLSCTQFLVTSFISCLNQKISLKTILNKKWTTFKSENVMGP